MMTLCTVSNHLIRDGDAESSDDDDGTITCSNFVTYNDLEETSFIYFHNRCIHAGYPVWIHGTCRLTRRCEMVT